MRAILKGDPEKGAGYGILTVFGVNVVDPVIILKRMSDGKTLTAGGWKRGQNSFSPTRWQNSDNGASFWLDPAQTDDLDSSNKYEISLPGLGTCALELKDLNKSFVIDENGADAWPPPPEPPSPSPDSFSGDQTIFEGVEKTPFITPDEYDASLPTGVIQTPADAKEKPRRKMGCLILAVIFVGVWIGAGVALWHGAMNAPSSAAVEDETTHFEIIPKATDSSFVEEDETGSKKEN